MGLDCRKNRPCESVFRLANDAKGAWVLVDAATGKQMTNPINGHSGSMVCSASNCGAGGYEGNISE